MSRNPSCHVQIALPALRDELDQHPAIWQHAGDLARQAELSLIEALAGDNLYIKESVARRLSAMRDELRGTSASPLELLLIDRIVANWLNVHYAETIYAQNMDELTLPQAEFHQRRISNCHRRYLTTIRR